MNRFLRGGASRGLTFTVVQLQALNVSAPLLEVFQIQATCSSCVSPFLQADNCRRPLGVEAVVVCITPRISRGPWRWSDGD